MPRDTASDMFSTNAYAQAKAEDERRMALQSLARDFAVVSTLVPFALSFALVGEYFVTAYISEQIDSAGLDFLGAAKW